MLIYKFSFALTLLLFSFGAWSQNTLSPYSRFSIGQIQNQGFGQSRSMGGIFNGLRTFNQINYLNPASYTSQDTNTFILDIGLSGNSTYYRTSSTSMTENNASLSTIALGFPIKKWWKSAIGVVPYSRVGYNILDNSTEAGLNVDNTYQGLGGVNQFFIGNSFLFFKKLSIGFNVNYMFGYISHTAKKKNVGDDSYPEIETIDRHNINDFKFNTGIQYEHEFSDKWNLVAGITYDMNSELSSHETFIYKSTLITGGVENIDTINIDGVSKDNVKSSIQLPEVITAGFSLELKDKLLFGLDYSMHNWGNLTDPRYNNFINCNSIALGVQYVPNKKSFRNYWKRINYRAGAHSTSGYLDLNGSVIGDNGISLGLGLPLRYSNTMFNITWETGRRGTTNNGLIEENYNIFMLNLSFYDFWFFKPKYD